MPKVFLSYSHDSENHKNWVLKLATDLRINGIDAILDQWDLRPGQDLAQFMQYGIHDSDRVVMVCSKNYVERADSGTGGVGYERLIVTAEVISSIDTIKFVPIVRGNRDSKKTPVFLGPRLYVDFEDDHSYDTQLQYLLRHLHSSPGLLKPALGENPFSGERPLSTSALARHAQPNNTEWFDLHSKRGENGIANIDLNGHMEFRSELRTPIAKSQVELLSSVKRSNIRHFGWPIAIVLDSRGEYRPQPVEDGIEAEIAIRSDEESSRSSYDYWSAGKTGNFFLLQSLFEDARKEGKIFFNTRIVRVAESLLFLDGYYKHLGVSAETIVDIRFTHSNIAGRELDSSNPRRHVNSRKIAANSSTSDLSLQLDELKPNLTEHVKNICAPLFMLFDYKEFDDMIYQEIVTAFENGDVI